MSPSARVLRPDFGSRPSRLHPQTLSQVASNLELAQALFQDLRLNAPEAASILNRVYVRYLVSMLHALRAEFGDVLLHGRTGVGVVRVEQAKEVRHG